MVHFKEWKTLLHLEKLIIYKLRVHHGTPQVYISIDIMPDFSWTTKIYGKMLPQSLPHTPDSLTTPNEISEVVKRLDCCTDCLGNEDPQYLTLAASRGGKFNNLTSENK